MLNYESPSQRRARSARRAEIDIDIYRREAAERQAQRARRDFLRRMIGDGLRRVHARQEEALLRELAPDLPGRSPEEHGLEGAEADPVLHPGPVPTQG